jgi:hypothetical protein
MAAARELGTLEMLLRAHPTPTIGAMFGHRRRLPRQCCSTLRVIASLSFEIGQNSKTTGEQLEIRSAEPYLAEEAAKAKVVDRSPADWPASHWGGVHGTWFWVDPRNDVIVAGMVQQVDAGNAMTGRPYPVPDIRGIARSIIYGALVEPDANS